MMLPPWLSALVLAAAMSATFACGRALGKRWPQLGKQPPGRIDSATVAIVGLLLAFTFSLALAEHLQRRQRAIDDANAIGNFYTCASLLDDPLRSRLQQLVRRYLERRVMVGHAPDRETALARELPLMGRMQLEMRQLVGEAVTQRSPVTIPLVETLNAVTSSHAARVAAVHHRLPWNILLLLGVAALVSAFVIGTQQGAVGDRNLVPVAVFSLLVCSVIWVTLDMNQPGVGIIRVSQEPFERLLGAMAR
jgi:hypothetical protein